MSDEDFKKMVEEVKANDAVLDELEKNTELNVYSLGKQGSEGDNTTPKPATVAVKDRLMVEAWTVKKSMDNASATKSFLALT